MAINIKFRLAFILCLIYGTGASATCINQFEFDMDIRSTIAFQGGQSQQRSKLQERISIVKLEYDKQGQWWGIKGDEVMLHIDNIAQKDADYLLPFAFKKSDKGLIIDFWFPQGISDQAKLKLRGMASFFQYPKSPAENSIEQTETDGVGSYIAHYTFDNKLINKRKSNYTSVDSANNEMKITIIDSNSIYTRGNCLLSAAHGDEQLTMSLLTGMKLDTSSHFTFNSRATILQSELFSLPKVLSKWQYSTDTEEVTTLSAAEIKKRSKQLRSFLLTNQLIDIDPFMLAKRLEKYQGALHTLTNLFTENILSENDCIRLINAIGLVDNQESQRLLVNIISHEKLSNADKFRAVQALADSEYPLDQNVYKKLSEMLDNGLNSDDLILNNSLVLTIGTIIRNHNNDLLADALQEQIVDKLSNSTDVKDKLLFINALGNTFDADMTSVIANYSNDQENDVRVVSAQALGRVGSIEAYNTLDSQLSIERVPEVKQALISSIGKYHMDDTVKDKVMNAAATHQDSNIRRVAILALSNKKNFSKEVKKDLQTLLKTEKSRANFQTLVRAIHTPLPKK